MPGEAEPELNPLERNFSIPAETSTVPLAAVATVRAGGGYPREFWLRVAMFTMLLGAVMTVLYAWFQAQPGMPLAILLAAAAVAGVLLLERLAVLAVLLMLGAAALGLAAGAMWLAPGAVLGCIWAARRRAGARATLGFVLLVPSLAAVYFGLIGGIGFALGEPVHGLPPALAQPLTMAQALAPLEFFPLAVLGAWLLVRPLHRG